MWTKGRESAIDEMLAGDAIVHGLGEPGRDVRGPAAFKPFFIKLQGAFSDIEITVEQTIAEGEWVASRWIARMTHRGDQLGVPATGRRVEVGGMSMGRFRGDKMAEAADAKRLILEHLSFDQDASVQVFEVTIRLLGGLLAAYQMDHDPGFLRLAADLGDRLLPAFQSPTAMPFRYVNLRTGQTRDPVSNPAEIGTLMLEFGTLGKLTGRPVYYATAKRAVEELFRRRSALGLVGSTIDVRTGAWQDTTSHVGGGIDSYYEYLLKSWLLFGDEDFRRMWQASLGPVNRYLADERFGGLWYGQVDMATGARLGTQFGSLEAFLPAVLALSGDTARAARLMASVNRMWTTFGLFAPSGTLDLRAVVFNTEAHLLRRTW